jgi:alkylation response protein AidB-like acyl-CoA dehydrogenase
VDLLLDNEQRALRDTVRDFLAERSPMSRVRAVTEEPGGWDRTLFTALAGELDLVGIAAPTRFGGAGRGWRELAVVCAELGATLAAVPYLGTVLAVAAITASADEQACADHVPGLVAGRTVGAWCPDGDVRVEDGRLSGLLPMVPDGCAADLLVVPATGPDGTDLFVVDTTEPGLDRRALCTLDPTRGLARITLAAVPARRLRRTDTARRSTDLRDRAATLLAAEQWGGLARCVRMTVEYATVREQFGRPIGAFQAVKHRLADLHATEELAESTVRYAAWAADEAPDELPLAACVAKSYLSDAFCQVTAETVHLHGGIGFTWEHDAHLYYKRARTSAQLHGDAVEHRSRIADLLLPAGRGAA